MRAIQMEATNDNEFGNSAVPVPKTGLGRSGSLGGETAVQSRLSPHRQTDRQHLCMHVSVCVRLSLCAKAKGRRGRERDEG